MTVLGVVLAILAAWWSSTSLHAVAAARHFSEPPPAVFALLMLLGFLMALIMHEAGHWVAGTAVGWRGLRFRLGPYALVLTSHGWRPRFIKWDFGAAVTFAPTSLTGFLKADVIFTAGGPASSALFGVICLLVACYARNGVIFQMFGAMAQWSWIGVLSLLPAGAGLARSDGYWLWQLARGGEELERRQRYMLANMSAGTELRPRDWPLSLMAPVMERAVPCPDRHDCYLVYIHLIDSGDPAAAFPWLAGVLTGWQKTDPPEYALEAAWYAAVHSHDAHLAAQWLACAGKDVDSWVRLRGEAAVASAEGRTGDAHRLAAQASAKLESVLPVGHRTYETARLADLLAETSTREVLVSSLP